jgi:hypothetical protein
MIKRMILLALLPLVAAGQVTVSVDKDVTHEMILAIPSEPFAPLQPATMPNGIISGGRIVAQGVDIEATTPDTGYILTDASTNKWLVTIADGEVIGVQISASPEIGMDERRTRLQAERTRRQAIKDELNLTSQQIDLIRQWADADIDTLFGNLNAQQRRFLKIQHQLVRMLAKRELKEMTD